MFWNFKKPPTRLEAARRAAQECAHEFAEIVHEAADGVSHHLDAFKQTATQKIAASRVQLDEAMQQATLQAEKEALQSRLQTEKERALLLAEHETWKAQLEKERLQLEKEQLKREKRTRTAQTKKRAGVSLPDEDEFDLYPLHEDDSSRAGSIFLMLFAVVLVVAALFLLLSNIEARRAHSTFEEGQHAEKEGGDDIATAPVATVAENTELHAAPTKAHLLATTEEVEGEAATSGRFNPKPMTLLSPAEEVAQSPTPTAGKGEIFLETATPQNPDIRAVENEIEATLARIESAARAQNPR